MPLSKKERNGITQKSFMTSNLLNAANLLNRANCNIITKSSKVISKQNIQLTS